MAFNEEVTRHSVHTLVFRSLKRTHDMFLSDAGQLPALDDKGGNSIGFFWNEKCPENWNENWNEITF